MAGTTIISKREAIAILQRGDREVTRLFDLLPVSARARRGIGGGDWSPIDLLGHLASWERHALEALEAWERRERAQIDLELERRGVNGVNADALAAASRLSPGRVIRTARETHAALIGAIRAIPADRWALPPLTRGSSTALRVGSILGGPGGPFRHADAHIPDLRAFVEASGR